MGELWDKIIARFCEVEFLCYEGRPNWLGWGVLVFFGGILVLAVFKYWLDSE